MSLHPIKALDHVIDEYGDYLRTEFRARDPKLREALEQELDAPRFLSQEPFYQAHRPFKSGRRWRDLSIDVNLTSHRLLIKHAIPFLREGVDPAIVFVGSRNVAAPGAGAAAYSVSKAGLTQMMRVLSLELAPDGVRVNAVHPDAVFDTGLWTDEALEISARRYGLTVGEYKTRNVLSTEVTSRDVARATVALVDGTLSMTTGAQVPVDGGNERVI